MHPNTAVLNKENKLLKGKLIKLITIMGDFNTNSQQWTDHSQKLQQEMKISF